MQFFLDLIKSKSQQSSSRFINLLGFIFLTIWISYDIFLNGIKYEVIAVYAGYCSINYMGGKFIGKDSNAQ